MIYLLIYLKIYKYSSEDKKYLHTNYIANKYIRRYKEVIKWQRMKL